MQFEKMTAEDVPHIVRMEREAFGEAAWSETLFYHELQDETKHYTVCKENGVLIAYGGFSHILDEAHIMNIAVEKTRRRGGVGRLLLEKMLKEMRALHIRAATLEVETSNAPARALYEQAGFSSAGVRKDYYGKGRGAEILWKNLGDSNL